MQALALAFVVTEGQTQGTDDCMFVVDLLRKSLLIESGVVNCFVDFATEARATGGESEAGRWRNLGEGRGAI